MTYSHDPNYPRGVAPPPPPPYGYPYPPQQQPPKPKRRWIWIVLVLGGLATLLCCGGIIGVAFFALNVMEAEIRNQVRDHPAILEHIGQIQSFDLELAESVAVKDDDTFVYRVNGSKGSGVLTVRHVTNDNGDEEIVHAELRTPDGKVHELKVR